MNKLQKLISQLEKHHKKKLDLSLGRTFNLLKKLGNPQDKLYFEKLKKNNLRISCMNIANILPEELFEYILEF